MHEVFSNTFQGVSLLRNAVLNTSLMKKQHFIGILIVQEESGNMVMCQINIVLNIVPGEMLRGVANRVA